VRQKERSFRISILPRVQVLSYLEPETSFELQ
jgi:hypothetical protein